MASRSIVPTSPVPWLYGSSNTVGSFISFQIPLIPASTNAFCISPHLSPRVIGENRVIGPDVAVEDRAIGAAYKRVAFHPFAIDAEIGIALHPGINNGYSVEAVAAQVAQQCLWIGEALRVPGKDAIAVHMVDIQVDRVAGDAAPRNSPASSRTIDSVAWPQRLW